ncbi:MAG: choice-of-anchor D domain-containing protein [Balneolia bacterium]|nr:choice-of-anchor D domain-containing protein [Balneolia bacterium]
MCNPYHSIPKLLIKSALLLLLTALSLTSTHLYAQVLPVINPESLEATLAANEQETVFFTITNSSSDDLPFLFPGFETTQRPAVLHSDLSSRFTQRLDMEPDETELFTRSTLQAWLDGELDNPDTEQQRIINEFESRETTSALPSEGLQSSNGFPVTFEELQLEGNEFVLYSETPISGTFTGYSADFVLDGGHGAVWTNDLAIVIATTPNLETAEIVLQLGGNFQAFNPARPYIQWQGGNAANPVQEQANFDQAFELDNVYVWVANGWWDDAGQWSGEVILEGINSQPSYISSVQPAAGTLSPGQTVDVEAVFSSGERLSGLYEDVLLLMSGEGEIEIPTALTVAGVPSASVSPASLDFGDVFIGDVSTLNITLTNTGNDVLTAENFSIDNPLFSVDAGTLSIPPFSSATVAVSFEPADAVTETGTLSFSTNDPENPSLSVELSGSGDFTPLIAVDPESLEISIVAGDTGSTVFTISNTGEGNLSFSIPPFDSQQQLLRGRAGAVKQDPAAKLPTEEYMNARSLIHAFESGRIDELPDFVAALLQQERYAEENDEVTVLHNPELQDEGSFVITLDSFSPAPGEFTLASGPLSGDIQQIVADFVLTENDSPTFASDLTLLFSDTPNPDFSDPSAFFLQLGGKDIYSDPFFPWYTGFSSEPGTPVHVALNFDVDVPVENIYLFVGHGFAAGGPAVWDGSISIIGLESAEPLLVSGASPASGLIPGGGSQEIELDINAAELVAGTYGDILNITSNDPINPMVILPLTLNVSGMPVADLLSPELPFGEVPEQTSETLSSLILNTGTDALELTNFVIDNPDYTIEESAFSVPPNTALPVAVTFTPQEVGSSTGSITFETNDTDNPQLEVLLQGEGVARAVAAVSPLSFEVVADAGDTSTAEIEISNSGSGVLSYSFPRFGNEERMPNVVRLDENVSELRTNRISLPALVANDANLLAISDRLMLAQYNAGLLNESHAEAVELAKERLFGDSGAAEAEENLQQQPAGSSDGFVIEMDGFTAFGGEFTRVSEALSGSLESITGDFVLNEASGITWASDLTVLITSTPEFPEHGGDEVLLQIGGTIDYVTSGVRLSWIGGNSSVPGTPIETTRVFDTPLELTDVYVWIGNGWVPHEFGVWSGEVILNGLGSSAEFFTDADPVSGTVEPGSSETVTLTVSTLDLISGTFTDQLLLLTNDPSNPQFVINGELTVLGEPDLVAGDDELDFGTIFTGTERTLSVVLSNPGTDVAEITSVSISGEAFSTQAQPFSLPAGSSASVNITFGASEEGTFSGELLVESNSVSGDVTVALSGATAQPGILTVDTTPLDFELPQNEFTTSTITLSNTGAADLEYNLLSVRMPDGSERPVHQNGADAGAGSDNPAVVMLGDFVQAQQGLNSSPVFRNGSNGSEALFNDLEVIWEQEASTTNGIVSTRIANQGFGIYSSDDFFIDGLAAIRVISTEGFLNLGASFEDYITAVLFEIYEDSNGKPAGHPDGGGEEAVFSYTAEFGSDELTVEGTDPDNGGHVATRVSLDLQQAIGDDLQLGDGRYWLVIAPQTSDQNFLWYQSVSSQGQDDAQIIDPSDFFHFGITEWSALLPITGEGNLAFRLEGTMLNFLSASPGQGLIVPGDSEDITLTVDATDLMPGEYQVSLRISTNSPATPMAEIPVTLVVTESESGLRWANLMFPNAVEIEQGEDFATHGMVKAMEDELLLSEAPIRMWVGFHTENKHPGLWGNDVWVEGSFYELHEQENAAEFAATAGGHLESGEYFFATRFQLDENSYVYGGYHEEGGGFWNETDNVSGRVIVTAPTSTDPEIDIPLAFELRQNYPNPFNPTTNISYALPEAANVTLEVFNMLGQRLEVLVNGQQNAGVYTVTFDAGRYSSGMYIYRITAGNLVQSRKMMLLK